MSGARAGNIRLTGGEWRGRWLVAPKGQEPTRPTPSMIREALFSILGDRIHEGPFLDVYAGTGAVAFEALSRGAPRATAVENHRLALQALNRNAEDLGAGDRLFVDTRSVQRFFQQPAGGPWAVVFADPPYGSIPEDIADRCLSLCAPGGIVAIQLPDRYQAEWLSRGRVRRYGSSQLAILHPEDGEGGKEAAPEDAASGS